jgi:DNA-binding CsgD family transcriptional regulator
MLEHEGKRKRPARATPREREVLELVLLGFTNKDIAVALGISDYTARDHVSALLRKNDVRNRAQLMALHVPVPRIKTLSVPLHLTDCFIEAQEDNNQPTEHEDCTSAEY